MYTRVFSRVGSTFSAAAGCGRAKDVGLGIIWSRSPRATAYVCRSKGPGGSQTPFRAFLILSTAVQSAASFEDGENHHVRASGDQNTAGGDGSVIE